jgi:hypothetical protein
MDAETLKLLEALSTHGSNLGVLVAVWLASRAVLYALRAVRALEQIVVLLTARETSEKERNSKQTDLLHDIHDDITRLPLELVRVVQLKRGA